jgi:hypothetical protein
VQLQDTMEMEHMGGASYGGGQSASFNNVMNKSFFVVKTWRPTSLQRKASEKLLDKISQEQDKAKDEKMFRYMHVNKMFSSIKLCSLLSIGRGRRMRVMIRCSDACILMGDSAW